MAKLLIDDDAITVSLSTTEKMEGVRGNVTVPRSAVVAARVVQDGMAEVQGIRSPGTSLPGLVMVGTWRQTGRTTFAVCHGRRPAVLVDLKNAPFDRLVVTVDDPEQALAALT
jgi:hypothetical protein